MLETQYDKVIFIPSLTQCLIINATRTMVSTIAVMGLCPSDHNGDLDLKEKGNKATQLSMPPVNMLLLL